MLRTIARLKQQMKEVNLKKAKHKADNERAMNRMMTKPVAQAAKRKKAIEEDEDEDEDVDEDIDDDVESVEGGDDDDDEEEFVVTGFRWRTTKRKEGYFTLEYVISKDNQQMTAKAVLFDYPEEALKLIFHKYGHDTDKRDGCVPYIEGQCRGYYEDKQNGIARRRVVPGFKTLKQYAMEHCFGIPEWNTKRQLLKAYPPCDSVEPKAGTKKTKMTKNNLKIPPPGSDYGEKILAMETTLDDGKGINNGEGRASSPDNYSSPNEDGGSLGSGGGGSLVDHGGELGTEAGIEVFVSLATAHTEKEGPEAIGGANAVEANAFDSPPKRMKSGARVEMMLSPDNPCMLPVRHTWEAYEDGRWVTNGMLADKFCIGEKEDGGLCGKEFVPTTLLNGKHDSETQFHPTLRIPAQGCTSCRRAMCGSCHARYMERHCSSPVLDKRRAMRNNNK